MEATQQAKPDARYRMADAVTLPSRDKATAPLTNAPKAKEGQQSKT